jgi:hypothetical protein
LTGPGRRATPSTSDRLRCAPSALIRDFTK